MKLLNKVDFDDIVKSRDELLRKPFEFHQNYSQSNIKLK